MHIQSESFRWLKGQLRQKADNCLTYHDCIHFICRERRPWDRLINSLWGMSNCSWSSYLWSGSLTGCERGVVQSNASSEMRYVNRSFDQERGMAQNEIAAYLVFLQPQRLSELRSGIELEVASPLHLWKKDSSVFEMVAAKHKACEARRIAITKSI